MTTDRPFLDTNILIYATVEPNRAGTGERIRHAERVFAAGGVVSVQVLNEFVDICRRKTNLSWGEINRLLYAVELCCGSAQSLTIETQKRAVEIAERYGFRIYDATIVASALEAGCTRLLSEDLQAGQEIEGLRVENPFAG